MRRGYLDSPQVASARTLFLQNINNSKHPRAQCPPPPQTLTLLHWYRHDRRYRRQALGYNTGLHVFILYAFTFPVFVSLNVPLQYYGLRPFTCTLFSLHAKIKNYNCELVLDSRWIIFVLPTNGIGNSKRTYCSKSNHESSVDLFGRMRESLWIEI